MLFKRHKLLLSLLQSLGGDVDGLDFQKLLFLYTRKCEKEPTYDFIPYRYGCFSFTSYADKRRLINEGLLVDDDQAWTLTEKGKRVADDLQDYLKRLDVFTREFGHLSGDELIRYSYSKYPYFAIRSEIIDRILTSKAEKEKVMNAQPKKKLPGIITIGYEGKSFEAYLNQLINNGVTLLCDVRRNPVSRKYGFSKGTLKKACEGVGIRYEHLAELGIESDRRQQLIDQSDYDRLLEDYEKNDLPFKKDILNKITHWIMQENQLVAVTCYEKLPEQCHRSIVAKQINKLLGRSEQTRHL